MEEEVELICRAQALFDFPAEDNPVEIEEGIATLTLTKGEIVNVFEIDASGWWYGELDGRRGIFPGGIILLALTFQVLWM